MRTAIERSTLFIPKTQLRFLTCGSVDDGKSTLIGRILYDSKVVFTDQLIQTQIESERFGTQGKNLDLALLVDGLQAEREQGITIDVAYRYFETLNRKFIAIDAPGHQQYTRNMVTGASNVETAIILVDVQKGILAQTRRHTAILHLLGVKKIILAVNKMDLVKYKEAPFKIIAEQYQEITRTLSNFEITAIPISALTGEGIVKPSKKMNWYLGPTIFEFLEQVDILEETTSKPFRLPVQWINRPNPSFRGFSGLIQSGVVKINDLVTVYPSLQQSKVADIITPKGKEKSAQSGQSVTIILADNIDITRGDLIAINTPAPEVADKLAAHVIWMDQTEMLPERTYDIRFLSAYSTAQIVSLEHKIDINTYSNQSAKTLQMNEIGYCKIALAKPIAFDTYIQNKYTGSFILIDRETKATVGAGTVSFGLRRSSNIQWHNMTINKETRAKRYRQKPLLVWFTGLSGSGKSTIADKLEQKLIERGHLTYLLDGDNVRHGLNKDLGFTDEDRVENIRRVAEVSKLMVDAGLIVLACFISPFKAEREMARKLLNKGEFIEVFVDASLETCEFRDPKGLYKKARAGKISNFTGIGSKYESPKDPEIHLNSDSKDVDQLVFELLNYLKNKL